EKNMYLGKKSFLVILCQSKIERTDVNGYGAGVFRESLGLCLSLSHRRAIYDLNMLPTGHSHLSPGRFTTMCCRYIETGNYLFYSQHILFATTRLNLDSLARCGHIRRKDKAPLPFLWLLKQLLG
ncbi:mCG144789, partial [Mus musculus]